MPKRLYTVTVEVELQVVADGEEEARTLGERYAGEEIANGDAVTTAYPTNRLPPSKGQALPYGEDTDMTCDQWLAEQEATNGT